MQMPLWCGAESALAHIAAHSEIAHAAFALVDALLQSMHPEHSPQAASQQCSLSAATRNGCVSLSEQNIKHQAAPSPEILKRLASYNMVM